MNVEAELWRIFTFYSLHYDANFPEVWKVTPFVRFAKDCQITSPKFMVSELELEIVRLVRNKRKLLNIHGVNGKDFDSAHTIIITFPDFLRLLEIIALRVYPGTEGGGASGKMSGGVSSGDPAAALRRLLLENVLLLASRRPAHVQQLAADVDAATRATVRETYGRALMGVFKYYVDLADKRRSQELALEAVKTGVTGSGNYMQSDAEAKKTRATREKLRSQKDLISFREYGQFCHDFALKSTTLLTAIEVGDVFLNVVEYVLVFVWFVSLSMSLFCVWMRLCVGLDILLPTTNINLTLLIITTFYSHVSPNNYKHLFHRYDRGTKQIRGMAFGSFCDAIVAMALLAYRDAPAGVSSQNKAKALLHFMWRGVNQADKSKKAATATKAISSVQHAGSLNQYVAPSFLPFCFLSVLAKASPFLVPYANPARHSRTH